jgi:hypothetical protein
MVENDCSSSILVHVLDDVDYLVEELYSYVMQ